MYEIKWLQELGWSVLIAVAVFLLTALTGIEEVSDIRVWLVSLVTGAIRVAAATALNELRKAFPPREEGSA